MRRETVVGQTAHGPVAGRRVGDALSFHGVRYGAPPVGASRFLPPSPPAAWSKPADAGEAGPSARQLPVPQNTEPFFSWYSAVDETSEDCLFLNIHTPALDNRRRPVLFWIHGGGWREYSGNAPGFDGALLAAREDVVVIRVNHRLGVFGYLSLASEGERFASSANAGLLDLVLALEWTKANVASFGGDPENVTIFGQSGGASKVAALSSMPRARGLFHKAIIQSSGGGLELATQEEAERLAAQFKRALGNDAISARELQALSADQLLAGFAKARGPFRGTIDHLHLLSHPLAPGTGGGAAAAGVPMLIGYTSEETTYYLHDRPEVFQIDHATARSRAIRFVGETGDASVSIVDRFAEAYPELSACGLLVRISTDFQFARNNGELARRQSINNENANVFMYRFSYPSGLKNVPLGAPHTSELPYIFGTLDVASGHIGHSNTHWDCSQMMMGTWTEFARTGDPNNALLPYWPSYSPRTEFLMDLQLSPSVRALDERSALRIFEGLPFAGYGTSRSLLYKD